MQSPSDRAGHGRTVFRSVAGVLLVSAFTALAGGPGAPPAMASCVTGGPQVSAHAFAGTVLGLGRDGRVAQVRTDDGRVVEVRGTPAPPDPSGGTSATSVDRTYEPGARYEFHPVNAAAPYEDNACTATHLLPALPARPVEPAPSRAIPVGPIVAAGLVLTGAAAVSVFLRRRARPGRTR